MSDAGKFHLFADIGQQVEDTFKSGINDLTSSWAGDLINLSSVCIACYIMFYGYLILAGKTQEPVKDLVWDLCRYAIVIGILQNITTYETLIMDAVNNLKSFVMGGHGDSAFDAIDQKFTNMSILFSDIWEKPSGLNVGSYFFAILQTLFLAPLLCGTIAGSLGFLIAELSTLALLAVFPLFLFCYLWGWFKDMFAMWLQAIIGVILFCLFLYLFSNIGFYIAKHAINDKSVDGWDSLIAMLIAGSVSLYGVKIAMSMSSALSKVTIHSAGQAIRSDTEKTSKTKGN